MDPNYRSATSAKAMTAGRYYMFVEESGNNANIDLYRLQIELLEPGCGNGVVENNEQCDDGNAVETDRCTTSCTLNEIGIHTHTPATQITTASYSATYDVLGAIDGLEVDLTGVSGDHYVDAEMVLTNYSGTTHTCAALKPWISTYYSADPYIRLVSYNILFGITEIGADDSSGYSSCSHLNPVTNPAGTRVAGGNRYWVEIRDDRFDDYFGDYSLIVSTRIADSCGNGVVESYPAIMPTTFEQCDDGNTASGDGCDSSCNWELSGTLNASGNVAVTFNSENEVRVIRLDLTAGQSVTATAGVTGTSCDIDNTLEFKDSNYVLYLSDTQDGPGNCGMIGNLREYDYVTDDLPAGSYYLMVRPDSSTSNTYPVTTSVEVGVTSPACGNGFVETNAGETCDDDDTDNTDGCTTSCLVASPIVTETEPNDSTSQATSTGLNGTGNAIVQGTGLFASSWSHDYYSFVIPGDNTARTVTIRAQGDFDNPDSCNGQIYLQLIDPIGTTLASDWWGGWGRCAQITSHAIPGLPLNSTYYVRAYHTAGYQALFSDFVYFLDITVSQ